MNISRPELNQKIDRELNRRRLLACAADPLEFIQHLTIYDATRSEWIPFTLWDGQLQALLVLHQSHQCIFLKARQLGMTWLCLGYQLWLMRFRPISSTAVFSRNATEACYLLGRERLRGMWDRLPEWIRGEIYTIIDQEKHWSLSNGSSAHAFPTTGGDGRTLTWVLVDEADLQGDLNSMLLSIKPTIDGGGKLVLLSKVKKDDPQSTFKAIWRASVAGENSYERLFMPWTVRPDRTEQWYQEKSRESLSETGSLDNLWENYPATPEQALAPSQSDKRLPIAWLNQCYRVMTGFDIPSLKGCPSLPGLLVYAMPQLGDHCGTYVIGADPAEGNPNSDPSVLKILRVSNGEEMASLSGRWEPAVFAGHLAELARWYAGAGVLVERNNHGHAVILALKQLGVHLYRGRDDKEGWLSNELGNNLLYTAVADSLKQQDCILHTPSTYEQLASIQGANLSAPRGMHDDEADAFGLALLARSRSVARNPGTWRMERL